MYEQYFSSNDLGANQRSKTLKDFSKTVSFVTIPDSPISSYKCHILMLMYIFFV